MDKPHKQLNVWHRSIDFAIDIYKVTSQFPANERYGLTSQMHRAVSVSSHLAERAARGTTEFIHFMRIAIASVSELDTPLEICCRSVIYSTKTIANSMKPYQTSAKC